ncbi:MAG TPA: LysR family transcriptional regulator, partial [Mycobacterium sp.]|nr:LysR family transcriptional regulator [Mycobacterium sp.]
MTAVGKIVVVGASGLIGAKVVDILTANGAQVLPASRRTGVDVLTGDGLTAALSEARVVLDVTDSPSYADSALMDFFTTSTTNLLAAGQTAGVAHHIALSVVGADRMPDSGYMRAKVAQESRIAESGVPHTIL